MLHILLIEDNPADVLMVREAIQIFPVKADLMVARDGEQLLCFIQESHFEPDIILTDLNVPKFDGFEFLEQVCTNRETSVIVLTGSENPADKRRAIEFGAKEYVVKPIDLDEFLNVVGDVIDRWSCQAVARGV
jgi:two-component system response regulator